MKRWGGGGMVTLDHGPLMLDDAVLRLPDGRESDIVITSLPNDPHAENAQHVEFTGSSTPPWEK